jgi:hypothetical protein
MKTQYLRIASVVFVGASAVIHVLALLGKGSPSAALMAVIAFFFAAAWAFDR